MKLRLREIREDNNLTQKEIAEYLKCAQQTYSRYENGKAQPSLQIIEKLAYFYKTSVDYLIGLTDEKEPYVWNKK